MKEESREEPLIGSKPFYRRLSCGFDSNHSLFLLDKLETEQTPPTQELFNQ